MCYLTTTTYSCSHTPLANPIQCSDRKGTRKYCQDISFFATDEAALCPRCCTRQESNGLDVSDIDERTEQVITSIKEDMEMLSPLTSDQEELLAELRRCVELYSHKLKKMEGEIAELADSASIPVRKSSLRSSQLSVRESRDDASTQDGENNQIKNLIAQVGAANRFWAGYVKHYENQYVLILNSDSCNA